MIYNSPEIIPAKIYFKILETGDLKLLSDEGLEISVLSKIWENIQENYQNTNKERSKELAKVLNISKQIQSIESNLRFVELALYCLRSIKDNELIDQLKVLGYRFNWKNSEGDNEITEGIFQDDLDNIERESEALEHKINRLTKQLPKVNDEKEEVPFDETVLMYSAFTGLGYIDPNKLPLTQYDALIVNGNKKIKALKEGNSNGKK